MIRQFAIEIDDDGLRLLDHSDELTPEMLHKVRVATKRLRGLWKLAEPEIGKKKSKTLQKRLKTTAKTISAERDHYVVVKTIGRLQSFARSKKGRRACKVAEELIRKQVIAFNPSNGARKSLLVRTFSKDRKSWKSSVSDSDQKQINRRLAKTYKKANTLADKCKQYDLDGEFHEWRRWTKYLFFQLQIIDPDDSIWLGIYIARLKKLGKWLGRRQDLHVLADHPILRGKTYKKHRKPLMKIIRQEDKRLHTDCVDLARRLFGYSPKEFEERIKIETSNNNRSGTRPS